MAQIHLETIINAPIERVFDLARSIDLHKLSTARTNERSIAGRTSGLIELGESVTWRAKHLGVYQNLSVTLVQFESPTMFEDVMTKGTFKSMRHVHLFSEEGSKTKMVDEFEFESPLGFLGKMINSLFLKNYMTKFLMVRNTELKRVAEGEQWRQLLGSKDDQE